MEKVHVYIGGGVVRGGGESKGIQKRGKELEKIGLLIQPYSMVVHSLGSFHNSLDALKLELTTRRL